MKNFITLSLIPFTIFFNSYAYSQEIDASLLQNLSSEQIDMAREALEGSSQQIQIEEDPAENKPESLIENNENTEEKSNIRSRKFGYDFISTSPTSIVATGDLPLPNSYKISIGDKIGVVLTGSKERIFDMKVQLDGTIFFPELGSVSVAGESFNDIKIKLNNLIQQSYIGVAIDLSLKDLSAKKITIVGTVNNPGTYLVNPFTTISNSLAYSGGIQEIGSLRNIQLIRLNGQRFRFDLYDLLIDGDRSNDITIESGDVIVVGAATKFVDINGMVKRPGSYEILPGENLSHLLKYALGFTGGANIEKLALSKLDTDSKSIINIVTSNTSYFLDNVLSVSVYPYQNESAFNVFVSGAVTEPGFYRLDVYNTLEELINKLDFIDVYPWLAVLEQFDEDNLVKSSTLFSLNDPSTYKSIKLLPNSKVFFANVYSRQFTVEPFTRSMISDYDLRINHKQGSFNLPVYGKYSVKSFVDLLGLDMSDVDSLATYISPLEDLVIKDDYQNMNFSAKKYNTITFRSPINDLISVSIYGAIEYPGTYTLQSDSTLEDLYQMVGNFKSEAFLDGIVFTRASIRERQISAIQKSKEDLNKSILAKVQVGENIGDINIIRALSETVNPEYLGRIAGNFKPGSSASVRTILLDGDSIVIPKSPNAINVLGEVLNPIAFEYSKKLNIRSAIINAGGYQDFADKRKVYVIKANGLIERSTRNIFVKNIDLEPGDTIIVPRKIITNNPGIEALLPITNILSDLAFSAAALESLTNNN